MASGCAPTASAVMLPARFVGGETMRLKCFSATQRVVTTLVTCVVADLRYWRCQRETGSAILAKAEGALALTCHLQLLQALQAGRILAGGLPQSRSVVDQQLLAVGKTV